MKAARYEIVCIKADGSTSSDFRTGAPQPSLMLYLGRKNKGVFITRYFPSKKAWLVYLVKGFSRHPGTLWVVPPQALFSHEDKDAAVMWAILNVGNAPS